MPQLLEAGLNLTVIGMGVVFVLLTLLVYVIRGMSALSRRFAGPAPAAVGGAAAHAGARVSDTGPVSDTELVGVISAAVAAHRKQRKPKS